MKILVYTDNHWCQYSSILRKRGEEYSFRLENQIKSINWAESLAEKLDCNMIVHCGDFFDSESLNSMELTALTELLFSNNIEHLLVVGNHEMGINTLQYSSANVLSLDDIFNVINKPTTIELDDSHQLCFLPYTLESNRKPLEEVFSKTSKKRIIFSHNDIAGIQLGKFTTKNGYSIKEIEDNCDLFINGHLHNGDKITDKIFNVGNLTGQNFSEDGFRYIHGIFVIDTDKMSIDVYRNPHAINFYKLDFTEDSSIDYINKISSQIRNAVVTIKCKEGDYDYLKKRFGTVTDKLVPHCNQIIESRFIIEYSTQHSDNDNSNNLELSVDHIKEFNNYIIEELGNSDIVLSELEEIIK